MQNRAWEATEREKRHYETKTEQKSLNFKEVKIKVPFTKSYHDREDKGWKPWTQKGHMITECRLPISKGKDKKRCLNQECS